MKLNLKTYGQGSAIVILHGLFGSLDNWVTHARTLESDYTVILVDQRNHGKSPHDPLLDYGRMAEDLRELMDDHGITQAHLLGHSMGGKTVMEFAGRYPDRVDRLIVADMAPREYLPHHDLVLRALATMDLRKFDSRKACETHLMSQLNDLVTTQFLLKGLGRSEDNTFEWKFNLAAILDQYPNILAAVRPDTFYGKTLFVSGGASEYVRASDHALIAQYFSDVHYQVMPNIGHWLHAQDPEQFLTLIRAFLQST